MLYQLLMLEQGALLCHLSKRAQRSSPCYFTLAGMIASGGVDFFLAGVGRTVDTGGKLAVHSWAGDGVTGDQVPRDDPQHSLYLDYYAEMGIPAEFYWFTLQAAPAEDIYYMTADEMAEYQMTTR